MADLTATSSSAPAPFFGAEAFETWHKRSLLVLFLLCLALPIAFEVGGQRLTPLRIYLMVAIIPTIVLCLRQKLGGVTPVDLLFIAFGLLIFVSLVVVHGASRIPFAGITAVELVGGYFVGRTLIRNAEAYQWLFRKLFVMLLILAPFALYEHLTTRMLIVEVFDRFFEVPTRDPSARGRIGLERVQGVFDHPILWGLFCSMIFVNLYTCTRDRGVTRILGVVLVMWLTFMSLSSGPMLAVLLQFCLLFWRWVTKGRWFLLIALAAAAYVTVDLLSDRTPIRIFIGIVSFNPISAWTRLAQLDAGLASIGNHPIIGIGFNPLPRPHWMSASIDNFWLLIAIKYGMPCVLSIVGGFILHAWMAARAKITQDWLNDIRVGHIVCLVALSFAIWTVHIWGSVSVFVMFYVGAGAWIYTSDLEADLSDQGAASADPAPKGRYNIQYSRFQPDEIAPAGRTETAPERDGPIYSRPRVEEERRRP